MDFEATRLKFKPSKIRLYFVGESPPSNGNFFYNTSPVSSMTNFTKTAFTQATGKIFGSIQEFLDYFKKSGCYLDDLCHYPVDKLPPAQRKQARKDSIDSLASRIVSANPDQVVCVLKMIRKDVQAAIEKVGRTDELHSLPFPGFGHQNSYIEKLAGLVQKLNS